MTASTPAIWLPATSAIRSAAFFDRFGTGDNLILVDPAMADNGKLYAAL